MVVKELRDDEARGFMEGLVCPECGNRVRFNGEGQAGVHRVLCFFCGPCDIIYQLLIEKKGVRMFDEVEKEGVCTLVPDKAQNKCNVCACGLYKGSDVLDP